MGGCRRERERERERAENGVWRCQEKKRKKVGGRGDVEVFYLSLFVL